MGTDGKTIRVTTNYRINEDSPTIDAEIEEYLYNALKEGNLLGEGSIGVVLDTHISDELREEGHVREMISKIQNMRKESGFQVADKIKLYVSDNEMLMDVIKKFAETIKRDTLTEEIIFAANREYTETTINGEKLNMAVEVIK